MEDWQRRILQAAVDYHNRMVTDFHERRQVLTLADVMDMADAMERERVNILGTAQHTAPEVIAFARDLRERLLSTWRWLALATDGRPVKTRPVAVEWPEALEPDTVNIEG